MQLKLSSLLQAAVLLVSSTLVVAGTDGYHAPPNAKRMQHKNIARSLEKRRNGVAGTYYDVYTGNQVACGGFPSSQDHIVAMNSPDFAGGSKCGAKITIHYQGKTMTAIVRDECPTCEPGGIDLTEGLFKIFAPTSVGLIRLDWNWGSGGGDDTPAPAPTHKAAPPPPKPSSTHQDKPKETHSSTHESSSSSTHSSTPVPTPSIPAGANNVANLFQAVAQLGYAVLAGASN